MRDLEHARMMLTMARKDLRAIEGMKDGEVFDVEIFGFHAQQSVEKALKAWLSFAGVEYPRTHDLEQLFAMLDDHGETIPEQFRALEDLSNFAVQFRYESFESLGGELDRDEVIRQVREIIEYIERLLGDVKTGG